MSKTLLVYPNPFHAVDHLGRPAGVLHYEPLGDGVTTFDERRFVGAQLEAKMLQVFPKDDARHSTQDTTFTYADEPVKVPATAYYKQAVARGELFAADLASAKICGISDKTFVEAGVLLERAREEAIGLLKRQQHEDHDKSHFEPLAKFSFGPMSEAVKAREEAAKTEKKADEEAAKKAAVEDAAKKAQKQQTQTPKGGE